jgi:protocatechuate 3,4-dioxygenase beta subunit
MKVPRMSTVGSRSRRLLVGVALAALATTQCNRQPATRVAQSPSVSPPPTVASPTSVASPAPTPSCQPGGSATPATTEGPYFKEGSPERTSFLESGIEGTKFLLTGYVLNTNCQPVSRAKLEFWHAGSEGDYDNQGYRLRGHQFTDAQGRYRLETIATGEYTGRTRHVHVKVQPPNASELTTQLFFPGDSGNARDNIFREALLMQVQDTSDGQVARFDFVVRA